MAVKLGKVAGLLGLLVLLSACASTFPKALMEQVDPTVSFPQLAKNPEAYRGRIVMVGGELIRAVPGDGETELEILQRPLTPEALPRLSKESQGRFLVRVPGSLKRELPGLGGLIAVIGEVQGARERGGEALPYLEARDLRSWPSSAALLPPPYWVEPWPPWYWRPSWRRPYWWGPYPYPFYPFDPFYPY